MNGYWFVINETTVVQICRGVDPRSALFDAMFHFRRDTGQPVATVKTDPRDCAMILKSLRPEIDEPALCPAGGFWLRNNDGSFVRLIPQRTDR